MTKNALIASLEAALDRAVDVAVDAQAAVDEARARARLTKAPKAFYTTAEMISEVCAARMRFVQENFPVALRAIRSQIDPNFRDPEFPPARPRTAHMKFIDEMGAKMIQAEQVLVKAKEEAARNTATAAGDNVVRLTA